MNDSPLKNAITGIAGCSARATSGHAKATQPTNAMNSRRLMASPVPRTTSGFKTISHFWIEKDRYTQTGHPHVRFGSKADMTRCDGDVRFTPESGHR
jgi:hypothetical protein